MTTTPADPEHERRQAEAKAQLDLISEMLDGRGPYGDRPLEWRLVKARTQSAVLRAVLGDPPEVERSLAGQLDEVFGSRWRGYASPIRALFEAADPNIVARLRSGAMENAIARRFTVESIRHWAREFTPDEFPTEPISVWSSGFETAAKLLVQELLRMAKASDEAAKQRAASLTTTLDVKLSDEAVERQVDRVLERMRDDGLLVRESGDELRITPADDDCWADYAQRMRAANESALAAIRSRSDRRLRDVELLLSDALGGEGPVFEDERESIERWISSLQARRLKLLDDGPPVYDRVEEEANPRRHEWAQLRACGMLYMANTVLHAFGWAIVVTDDGDAYPTRTSWRGFPETTQARAHHDIASYLRLAGDALVAETEPEGEPF